MFFKKKEVYEIGFVSNLVKEIKSKNIFSKEQHCIRCFIFLLFIEIIKDESEFETIKKLECNTVYYNFLYDLSKKLSISIKKFPIPTIKDLLFEMSALLLDTQLDKEDANVFLSNIGIDIGVEVFFKDISSVKEYIDSELENILAKNISMVSRDAAFKLVFRGGLLGTLLGCLISLYTGRNFDILFGGLLGFLTSIDIGFLYSCIKRDNHEISYFRENRQYKYEIHCAFWMKNTNLTKEEKIIKSIGEKIQILHFDSEQDYDCLPANSSRIFSV